MDHLVGYLFWGVLILAVLRMATGALAGWIMVRLLPRRGSTGRHVLAGLAGGVILPVVSESIFGAPLSLINEGMRSTTGMVVLLAYIVGFSAVGAVIAVFLYRNFKLQKRQD